MLGPLQPDREPSWPAASTCWPRPACSRARLPRPADATRGARCSRMKYHGMRLLTDRLRGPRVGSVGAHHQAQRLPAQLRPLRARDRRHGRARARSSAARGTSATTAPGRPSTCSRSGSSSAAAPRRSRRTSSPRPASACRASRGSPKRRRRGRARDGSAREVRPVRQTVDFGLSDAQVMLRAACATCSRASAGRARAQGDGERPRRRSGDPARPRRAGHRAVCWCPRSTAASGSVCSTPWSRRRSSGVAPPAGLASTPAIVMAPLLLPRPAAIGRSASGCRRSPRATAIVAVALDEPRTTAAPARARSEGRVELAGGRFDRHVGYVADAAVADVLLIEVGGSLVLLPRERRGPHHRAAAHGRRHASRRRAGPRRVALTSVERLPGRAAARRRACAPGGPHRARRRRAGRGARRPAHRRRVRQAARAVQPGDRLVPGGQAHVRRDHRRARPGAVAALVHRLRLGPRADADAGHSPPLLKAHATETATDAVTTCTQVFGGIGFTWECDMHLYFNGSGTTARCWARPRSCGRRLPRPTTTPSRPLRRCRSCRG